VYLTIEDAEYPKYRLTSKNTSDAVASFSKEVVRPALWWTPYIGLDVLIGAVTYSEFDQFKVDRLLMKHLGREAHEPVSPKTGKPVYTIISDDRHFVQDRLKCKYCGHDEILYDERGFKYCTKCYSIQDDADPIDDSPIPISNHVEPDVYDTVYSAWYRQRNPEAVGVSQ
jgi:hypothetical protein